MLKFTKLCVKEEYTMFLTSRKPEKNGCSEHDNRTLVEAALAM